MTVRRQFIEPVDVIRFQCRIRMRGDCYEYIGAKCRGYGQFSTLARKQWIASRLAYTIAKGPIPDRLTVDHLCNHPWCLRPSHLVLATVVENVMRGNAAPARNARKTHCSRGHPFTAENTYQAPGALRKCCRICHRTAAERYEREHRAERTARRRVLRQLKRESSYE